MTDHADYISWSAQNDDAISKGTVSSLMEKDTLTYGITLIVELRWPADVVQEMVIAELSIFYRSPEGSMTRSSETKLQFF